MSFFLRPRLLRLLSPAVLLLLAACTTTPPQPPQSSIADSDWARASAISGTAAGAQWVHQIFGSRKATTYIPQQYQGRAAMYADSQAGTSGLRINLNRPGPASGQLRFSWWVNELNPAFNLADRDASDAVTNVILTFDGDRSRLNSADRMLSELALLTTGEPMPYASLIYLWDNKLPVGTVLNNAYTDRIRFLVVESGPDNLGRWLDYERDIAADYQKAFGEAPGTLQTLSIMTDANNSQSEAQAWYGPVTLQP